MQKRLSKHYPSFQGKLASSCDYLNAGLVFRRRCSLPCPREQLSTEEMKPAPHIVKLRLWIVKGSRAWVYVLLRAGMLMGVSDAYRRISQEAMSV